MFKNQNSYNQFIITNIQSTHFVKITIVQKNLAIIKILNINLVFHFHDLM
jgi:hypothetical protein